MNTKGTFLKLGMFSSRLWKHLSLSQTLLFVIVSLMLLSTWWFVYNKYWRHNAEEISHIPVLSVLSIKGFVIVHHNNTLCLNVRLGMQQLPLKCCASAMRVIFVNIENEQAGLSLFKIFAYCIAHPPTTIQFWSIIHSFRSQLYLSSVCSFMFLTDRKLHLNASKDSSALYNGTHKDLGSL